MAKFDAAKAIFAGVDANQDGKIDRDEFQNWLSISALTSPSSSQDTSISGIVVNNDSDGRAKLSEYDASSQNIADSTAGGNNNKNVNTASVTVGANERASKATIETSSVQETNEYLTRMATGVYNDPNPEIIRRAAPEGPIVYQQKIFIRFLQPPPVPPPGPLIIKEVRPQQPPPPPPLIVRQRAPPLPAPPPLILRERPPEIPASVGSETVVRHLKPLPAPPRSVVIERLPPPPQKPRDIIIERWIPYGPFAKRRTVVQRAPPPIPYPQPRNIIVVYDDVQTRVVRRFERLGVIREDPQAYVARYGASLLDASQLIQQARNAGVVEDLSPPAAAASSAQFTSSAVLATDTHEIATAAGRFPSATQTQRFSSSSSPSSSNTFDGLQVVGDLEANIYNLDGSTNVSPSYASSLSSNFVNDSALSESVGIGSNRLDTATARFAVADTNRDGRLNRTEFQRYLQGGI
ncbi:unnamed protein product [Adineta ricciae]|uniref:EF-hand domain-containing protein n=1 Tax=Adineta ricciae TaxID=249248 RepID=A0A815GAU0_ADIRI|nr:unnamed protein product [Adineta ricciae]CAF1336906.1 unnamed protein product [Adineta ricciae]